MDNLISILSVQYGTIKYLIDIDIQICSFRMNTLTWQYEFTLKLLKFHDSM